MDQYGRSTLRHTGHLPQLGHLPALYLRCTETDFQHLLFIKLSTRREGKAGSSHLVVGFFHFFLQLVTLLPVVEEYHVPHSRFTLGNASAFCKQAADAQPAVTDSLKSTQEIRRGAEVHTWIGAALPSLLSTLSKVLSFTTKRSGKPPRSGSLGGTGTRGNLFGLITRRKFQPGNKKTPPPRIQAQAQASHPPTDPNIPNTMRRARQHGTPHRAAGKPAVSRTRCARGSPGAPGRGGDTDGLAAPRLQARARPAASGAHPAAAAGKP